MQSSWSSDGVKEEWPDPMGAELEGHLFGK